jgi:hypothetical protein
VRARVVVVAALAASAACAPKSVVRPRGARAPLPNGAALVEQATSACRAVRTITAEISLSGRAGRQKLRGRAIVGAAPGAVRLEGVAPFGPPAFILVARNGRGTLLLPRDHRILRDAPAERILEALTGVSLTPDALRGLLTGCFVPDGAPRDGEAYGDRWAVLGFGGEGQAYLRRDEGEWHLVAAKTTILDVEYDEFSGSHPRRIRVRTPAAQSAAADLGLVLSQVELNVNLDANAFEINVPDDAEPLTLDELQRAGPLGARDR